MIELNEQDYQSWRHHPVTKVFLQYLRDYASVLERNELALWKSGKRDEVVSLEARGRVLVCEDMADLQFEHIREFYRQDEPEE